MNSRHVTAAALLAVAAAAAAGTRACAQEPPAPGVFLGLQYDRGIPPRIIVMPVDTVPGDSVRTIITRDLDYGNRVVPFIPDDVTMGGLVPAPGQPYNYALFSQLGILAIVEAKRAPGGYDVAAYDVRNRGRLASKFFRVGTVPEVRDSRLADSVTTATSRRERLLRDSVQRVLRARADIMRRPPMTRDTRDRRFVVRDSLRRDSTANAYLARNLSRWEDDRRDSVVAYIRTTAGRLARQDSVARTSAVEARRMGIHNISDEVTLWLTARRGIASSRIAYVHSGLIRIVDSDGANDRPVTRSGLSLSPSWHPQGDRLVYSKFLTGGAGTQLEEFNLTSGRTRTISGGGLNITPVYSVDGRHVVYASGSESGTDLMMVSTEDPSVVQRLTFGRGSDNGNPSFSHDGRQIAFFSSRSRFPQIYTMDADGTNVQLLTPFTPGIRSYRSAPDWSPDGRHVAYEQQMGDFQVWMIGVRDREARQLTSDGENEGPSWAPDGRHMAISSTRGGSKQIWILDTESGRFRQLTRNPGARLAAWSPMINVTH